MNNAGQPYFKLLLSLPENECLRIMARIAVQNHLSALMGKFRGEAILAGKEGTPPPDLEDVVTSQMTWMDTHMRIIEALRLAYARGETTVCLTRDVFMALKSISEGTYTREANDPRTMAICAMIEVCAIGIQAAFASAHEHLDRQTEPENIFSPSRVVN
jgi:hypothetical protein